MPRVFISHSAKEPLAAETIEALHDKLSGRFDVFLDRERLGGGDWWRDEIYRALASCHAAVLVLSKAAVDDSYWVGHEASILSMRAHVELGFAIIPVLLPPVTPGDLRSSKWEPRNLVEIQGVGGDDPAAIAAEVDRRLDQVAKRYDSSAPSYMLERHIAGQLETVPESTMAAVAARVELELGHWAARADRHGAIAQRLLGVELSTLFKVAQELAVFDPKVAIKVFDLAAPSWVHPDAARALFEVVERAPAPKAAAVNALQSQPTGEMYVLSANYRWRPRSVGLPFQEAAVEVLAAGIKAELEAIYALDDPAAIDEELREDRTVLIVPHPPPDAAVIDAVMAPYPNLTVLFMTGEEGRPVLSRCGLDFARYLEPELEAGRERELVTRYPSFVKRLKERESKG
jgi:hypothetical protein